MDKQQSRREKVEQIFALEEQAKKEKNLSHEHFYKYLYSMYSEPFYLPYDEYLGLVGKLSDDDKSSLIALHVEYERLLEEVEYLRSKLGISKDPYAKARKEREEILGTDTERSSSTAH